MYGRHHHAGDCGPAFKKHGFPFYGKSHRGFHGGPFRRPKYNVPLNIVEQETQYEVHVYALGFAKENIKIAVVDDVLYISGTRTVDENNLPNFSQQEYPIKSFERIVSLNGKVDTSQIKARQEEGVLIITLPKLPEAQQPTHEVPVE